VGSGPGLVEPRLPPFPSFAIPQSIWFLPQSPPVAATPDASVPASEFPPAQSFRGDQNPRPRQNANQGPRPRDAALRQRHIDEIQKAVGQRLEPKKKQVEEPEKMANVTCFNCT
jgi:hypothetical protein